MCIKIGGYVRFESSWNTNSTSTRTQGADLNNRWSNELWYRVRGYITADARNQTEYGTVRGYIAVGILTDTAFDPPQTFNANRAFIQWAGFTFGRAQSFFDFFSQAAIGYLGFQPNSDTGDGGKEIFGYTAQFGNGWSASLSGETRRMTQIIGQGINVGRFVTLPVGVGVASSVAANCGGINAAQAFGSAIAAGNCYGGWQVPDIVGNIRVDQAWGSAQIAGAGHQVNPLYFNSASGTATPGGFTTPFV